MDAVMTVLIPLISIASCIAAFAATWFGLKTATNWNTKRRTRTRTNLKES